MDTFALHQGDRVTRQFGAATARGLGGVLLDLTSARATFLVGGCGLLLVTVVAVVLLRGTGRGAVDA